jgi:C4-dicarboxylate-binding protein DctP
MLNSFGNFTSSATKPGRRSRRVVRVGGLVAAGVAISLLATACSSSGSSSGSKSSGPTITGKFGFIQAANTPTGRSATKFANLVSKYTNGKVKITVYPNSELGTGDSMLQATEGGTTSFYSSPVLSSAVPESSALELPFLFPTLADASKVLNNGSLDSSLWNKFGSHGLTYMGSWMVGYSAILTRDTKITTPADVKGLRIRVFEPVVSTKLYSALQATAVTLDGNQVVSALSTHTIDGVDDPPSTLTQNNFYDGMHDVAVTNIVMVASPVIASSKFMDSLSSSEKAAVKKAMSESIAPNLADANKTNTESLATMTKAGLTVTHPAKAPFKSIAAGVTSSLTSQFSGVISAVNTALAK